MSRVRSVSAASVSRQPDAPASPVSVSFVRGGLYPLTNLTRLALTDLADRLSRLAPSHRDPERFHMDKSELVAELRRLAREAGR